MRLMLPLLLSSTTLTTPFLRTATVTVRAFSPSAVSRTFRSSATLIPTTTLASAPFFRTRYSKIADMSSKALRASSSESAGKDEAPFTTWTFDKACETMDWTASHGVTMTVVGADDGAEESDLIICGVYAPASDDDEEEEKDDEEEEDKDVEVVLDGKAAALDEMLGGALTDVAKENAKAFKNGAVAGATTPTVRAVVKGEDGVTKSKRYILIGMGKAGKKLDSGTMTKIGSTIATKCDGEKGATSCAVHLPANSEAPSSLTEFSQGFYNTLYSDNRYRTGKNKKTKAEDLSTVTIVTSPNDVEGSVEEGAKWATGLYLGRDIVNAPHNILNSVSLATTAQRIADESGGAMTCEILGKEECEARGMGAYLGVARGSETPPQFIHLTYKPQGDVKKKVGIIGKGLLFDTGGYNIKVAMMELMKFDCGGAGAVLGAARAVAALQPEGVEAHFIVAACENMINDRAVVPSDILTASNGKTIEVLNTDAEGRLTLADALVFADKELGCESIIELSTLTGACMISLGKDIAGVWTSNDDLAKELEDISKLTGDKSWRMPLAKEYEEQLKSMIADEIGRAHV